MAAVKLIGSRRKGKGCWLAEVAAAGHTHHVALHKRHREDRQGQAHQCAHRCAGLSANIITSVEIPSHQVKYDKLGDRPGRVSACMADVWRLCCSSTLLL